jgi:alpha-amylase
MRLGTLVAAIMIFALGGAASCVHRDWSAKVSDFGPQLEPRSPESTVAPKKIDWSREVMYFMLVDRFSNGNEQNDGAGNSASHVKPGSLPQEQHLKSYQGGDLQGILNKLDYLKEMGITALWISPVMKNDGREFLGWWPYHGYHPYDHYALEEHFGDIALLKKLVNEAHRREMKVVLDMVYNQVSPHHPWVRDSENWEKKGFKSWFHPHSGTDDSTSIRNWYDQNELETKELYGLPDFNQDNPNVYAFLLDVSRYWVQQTGADGFRLDAVKHINQGFWRRINADMHKLYGKDFLMLGEVFDGDPKYLSGYQGLGFNALFDIPLYYTIRGVFASGNSMETLSDQLLRNMKIYGDTELKSTLIDNHDVVRFSYLAEKNVKEKIRLAMSFVGALNGLPVLYYGTEVALEGGADKDSAGQSTDYLNRRMFPWDRVPSESQKGGTIDFLKRLFTFRKTHKSLYGGKFVELAKNPCSYAFAKVAADDVAVAVFNNCGDAQKLEIPVRYDILKNGEVLTEFLEGKTITVADGKLSLELPPLTSRIYAFAPTTARQLPADYDVAVSATSLVGGDFTKVVFQFKPTEPGVTSVFLAGDFNGWNAKRDAMKFNADAGRWELLFPLKKGRYQYKFVLNGDKWVTDAKADEFAPDPYGGKNSIIVVK